MTQDLTRCSWAEGTDSAMQIYHDQEWGKLNLDEHYLYEMLVLEAFQSGLNWSVILHKRENFRSAFANFDPEQVANFGEQELNALLQNSGIVRHRLKIAAAIENAKVITHLHQAGSSFSQYLTSMIAEPIVHHPQAMDEVPQTNELATKMSKNLKQAGFKFIGPVTVYSFLQAVGLINDHLERCDFKY